MEQAGLSEEERDEIDAAVAPEVVAVAAAVATLPADEGGKSGIDDNSNRDVVDVGRFLDLCGIPPTAPQPVYPTREMQATRGAAPLALHPEVDGASQDSDDHGYFSEETSDDVALITPLTPEGEGRGRKGERNMGGPGGVVARDGGGRDEGAERAAAAAMDELALRRISHQADLYGRLMVRGLCRIRAKVDDLFYPLTTATFCEA